jgi:hypothetical protein
VKVTPKFITDAVESVRPALFESLEYGYGHLITVDATWPITDPHVRATLIRYGTREHLARQQPPDGGWAIDEQVPFSGIHLTLPGGHRARVLAAAPGAVPPAGHSQARRAYWSGNSYYAPRLFDIDDPDVMPLNLLLLWNVDPNGVIGVRVAAPEGNWTYQAKPICSAVADLAHPSLDGFAFTPPTEDDVPLVEIDQTDIDIERGNLG